MQKCFYNTNLHSLRATNLGIFAYSIYESIILDKISINGITNFGLEVKNNSNSGNVTKVLTYGSPNGFEYFAIENDLFNAAIGPGELQHIEFVLVTGFLRISVQTDADINIDIYLHGNIT